MSGCGLVFFVALVILGTLAVHSVQVRRWKRVGRSLGLEFGGGLPLLTPLVLRGRRDDLEIEVLDGNKRIFVTISGPSVVASLELKSESLLTRTLAPDVLTGDARFDDAARVLGREPLALALLDARAREAVLREVVAGQATFERAGRVRWLCRDLREVPPRLSGLVDLASRLRAPGEDLARRLAENSTSDPDRAVRLRNLRVLQEHYPESRAAREASVENLRSERAELRLQGALFLGGCLAGRIERAPGPDAVMENEAVETLAELATARNVPKSVNATALRAIVRPDWKERALEVLDEACRSGWPEVRRSAVEELGRLRHRPAVDRLTELASGGNDRLAEAVAEALGRIGDPAGETALLELLEREDRGVRLAAIRALGRIGTVRAVEPLLEIAGGLGLSREAREAETAKSRIQLRVDGAEAGQLSLAEPASLEGAVSPAEGGPEAGAVSLAEEEDSP